MSERKVLNVSDFIMILGVIHPVLLIDFVLFQKYYPPDFDPSKIPRAKLPKNRQYTVRLMAPFNMRCKTCGEYIYKGKKFNARKEDVENETYLGIRIYRFYIKCTRCLQEISFKTDPKSTDYEIEAGATRNFMALKLALEQEEREEQEAREEEKNNPMKLLEARTEQSRNEIEILESLEELKYLNKRQEEIDYDSMLDQFKPNESAREREERLQKLDEDYIKTIKFGADPTQEASSSSKGVKRVADEVVEVSGSDQASNLKKLKEDILGTTNLSNVSLAKKNSLSIGVMGSKKSALQGLVVKKKVQTHSVESAVTSSNEKITPSSSSQDTTENKDSKPAALGGLSLLGAYSDSDESSDS